MLQGHAGMLTRHKQHRVATLLVLVNVSLVVLAALWRHAAADDAQLAGPGAADEPTNASQVEPRSAEQAKPEAPAASSRVPSSDDPVMEELRKVIREPNSGLAVPRLDETSPLASQASSLRSGNSDKRLQQRIETVHSLSAAALALIREARELADAGQAEESAALMRHAAELRKMIAALADERADQP